MPGDPVSIGPGTYPGPLVTQRSGTAGARIRLVGDRSVVRGESVDDERLLTIRHSWWVVTGLTLTHADKGIWLQKASHNVLRGNTIAGTGGECVRVKYYSVANELAGNRIGPCGLVNFDLEGGHKNGEGIYVGTAPEQLARNPSAGPDASNRNWIHDNAITPRAECVDLKEHAERNLVERNTCSGGLDPDGSGLESRGNRNTFRDNTVTDYVGKGIRFGGDTPDQGIRNDAYGNTLQRTGSYAIGAMRLPQGKICGNTVGGNRAGRSNVGAIDPASACP
jgi:hypothetical protein